nr:hypothetical protein [uncultured Roseateles sp.]
MRSHFFDFLDKLGRLIEWVLVLLACVFVVVLVSITPAKAQTLGVHIGSQHYPARDRNNVNPGIYYVTESGWLVGGYHNSFRKLSLYGGHTWQLWQHEPTGLRADVAVMLATGYNTKFGLRPGVLPSVAYPVAAGWRARLSYGPRTDPKASHLLHLSIEREWR